MRKSGIESSNGLFAWALYDWANSAYFVMIQTFIFAAYFASSIAENETQGTALWGYMVGAAGLVIGFSAPILGAIADEGGRRKPWIIFFSVVASVATCLLWFAEPSMDFLVFSLVLAFVATVCTELSLIFYNAMLPDLADSSHIGRWSGWGWALGFLGGLVCLIIGYFVLFLNGSSWFGFDEATAQNIRSTFIFTGLWYVLFSLPMFFRTKDVPSKNKKYQKAISDGMHTLREGIRMLKHMPEILRFLIARMFYNDAIVTIYTMGGVYAAATFGLTTAQIFYFGIGLNVTAGIGSYAFAWMDDKSGSKKTIMISLIGLIVPVVAVIFVETVTWFWIWGLLLGIFFGPVQAASRTMMGRIAPEEHRNQMYGLFALSGKLTSFIGPFLFGWITMMMDNQRWGMGVIILLLLVGLVLMLKVEETDQLAVKTVEA